MRSGYLKSAPERIRVVDVDDVESGMDRGPLDGRHDGRVVAQRHPFFHSAREAAADVTLVDEPVPRRQPSAGHELRHASGRSGAAGDRKSTRLNSSHVEISYAGFCLKKTRSARRSACASTT